LYRYIFVLNYPEIIDFLEFQLTRKGLYSINNAYVATFEDEVVGMYLAYKEDVIKDMTKEMIKDLPGINTKIGFRGLLKMILRLGLNTNLPKIEEGEFFLSNIAVNEKMRGQNIGKELMLHYEKTARENKCEYCSLFVEVDNDRAIKFYKNMGYEEKEERILNSRYKKYGLHGFKKMIKKVTFEIVGCDQVPL